MLIIGMVLGFCAGFAGHWLYLLGLAMANPVKTALIALIALWS